VGVHLQHLHQPGQIFHHNGMCARKRPLLLCVYSLVYRQPFGFHLAGRAVRYNYVDMAFVLLSSKRLGGIGDYSIHSTRHLSIDIVMQSSVVDWYVKVSLPARRCVEFKLVIRNRQCRIIDAFGFKFVTNETSTEYFHYFCPKEDCGVQEKGF
jgi:hypothetical protein